MSDFRQPLANSNGYAAGSSLAVRNRVMRNTYWLLALSLIPTVLGAMVGLNTGINQVMGSSPGTSAIVFLIGARSEEHTSELQSLMRISYAVFCLKKKKTITTDKSN